MKNMNRRRFLKTTAATAAIAGFPAIRTWPQALSASDEIRVGVVGFRGRGQNHLSGLSGLKGVRITGLCDVDQGVLDKEAAKWKKKGEEVEAHLDVRRLLDSNNVDVISIATPNHWHALGAIWAVQAGKDVYLEKPVSHNVWEGRKIVEAARKYNKIVQTGTQSRSSRGIRECFAWLKEGNLGKLVLARGLCYKPRPSIGKVDGPQPIPEGIDYNLWCGPAPMRPLTRKNLHYDWHWVWDTGNGDLGNQGIHQMDIARWAMGVNQLSPRVFSVGGRLGYIDDGETPNTMFSYHDYPGAPLIFEVRGLPEKKGARNMDSFEYPAIGPWKAKDSKGELKDIRASVAVVLEYEGGYVVVPNYNEAIAFDRQGKEVRRWSGSDNHFADFIDAVRSRKWQDLSADILEGHLSSALCHTGNISYLAGRKRLPSEIREALNSDREATETFDRMAAHLERNEVNIQKDLLTMGQFLKMDPSTERFLNNNEANTLLTRNYREPFVVPEKV